MVLLGEIRQWRRILFTDVARRYFGTARRMSKTFAVSSNFRGVKQKLVDRK